MQRIPVINNLIYLPMCDDLMAMLAMLHFTCKDTTAEGSLGISISYSNGQHQVRLHVSTLPSGWLDNSFPLVVVLLQQYLKEVESNVSQNDIR